jgi:hypothetical protein
VAAAGRTSWACKASAAACRAVDGQRGFDRLARHLGLRGLRGLGLAHIQVDHHRTVRGLAAPLWTVTQQGDGAVEVTLPCQQRGMLALAVGAACRLGEGRRWRGRGFGGAPGRQQRARKPADLRAGAAFALHLPQGIGGTAVAGVERQQLEPLAHGGLAVAAALRSLGSGLMPGHALADLLPCSRQPAGHGAVVGPQQAQHLPGQGGLGPSALGLGPFGPVLLLLLESIGRCRRGGGGGVGGAGSAPPGAGARDAQPASASNRPASQAAAADRQRRRARSRFGQRSADLQLALKASRLMSPKIIVRRSISGCAKKALPPGTTVAASSKPLRAALSITASSASPNG